MDRAKRLFEDVNADPTVIHAESPGAVPLEGPLADPTPLTGRQAELVDCQATRLDTRRIGNSEASPIPISTAQSFIPRIGQRRVRACPSRDS